MVFAILLNFLCLLVGSNENIAKTHRAWCFSYHLMTAATAVAGDENKASDLPIFDAHIHYSHDVWQVIPPADAIRRLREAGVERALVLSSSDEGKLGVRKIGVRKIGDR